MIKYKTGGYGNEIEEIEIVRETAHFIFITITDWQGRKTVEKTSKSSTYERYHDTWKQARDYLYAQAELNRDRLLERLKDVEAKIKEIEALEE